MEPIGPRQVAILDAGIAAVLARVDLQELAGKRVFITGGTGFFGLWLLSALRAMHARQMSVDTCVLSRNPDAFVSRYPQFGRQPWLRFLRGDVRDFQIPAGHFDYLLHGATETSRAVHADATRMFDDIVIGTRQVFRLARQCGVRRMLLISSGAVYGPQQTGLTHRPDDSSQGCDPLLPASAYGEGKRVMELMGAMLQQEAGIEFVAARCFSFCGPGLPIHAHFAIGNFIRDALYRERITVQGDGCAMRSYLYGADLAIWLLHLLVGGRSGEAYNVGSDEALSVRELAHRVRDVLAPGKPVEVLRRVDVEQSAYDRYVPAITRARSLGCAPWTSLTESLLSTGRYLQVGGLPDDGAA